MLIKMLENWKGSLEVNGVRYDSYNAFSVAKQALEGNVCIKLYPQTQNGVKDANMALNKQNIVDDIKELTIKVKNYMTEPSSPGFDFMAKWNNDKPMPMRIMAGTKVKETRGMVYMKLHGLAKPTVTCYCCGKELTNPVSRKYGIGPVCLSKMGITNDIEDVEGITEKLVDIQWEGWIIKSAILEEE